MKTFKKTNNGQKMRACKKGSVMPHPAIKIEQEATKTLVDLLSKHKRLPLTLTENSNARK